MKKSVGDLLVEGLRELTETLQSNTPVSEKFTCHQVSLELCPTAYDAALVKQTREVLNASQAIFARFIGVSVKTVSSWEQGATSPSDMACRFMDEIRLNPAYWQVRLAKMAVSKSQPARPALV